MPRTDRSRPILVASAFDASSDEALRQGVALAAARNVRCVVCHVLPEIVGRRPLFPQFRLLDRATVARFAEVAQEMFEAQASRVRAGGQAPPEFRLESGTPHAGILAAAEATRAQAIVVGAEERPAVSLGGIGERVVRDARVPVLVARAGGRAGGPVIAATDISDPSAPAVAAGAAEARQRGARLVLLHVLDLFIPMAFAPEGFPITAGGMIESYRAAAQQRLRRAAARFGAGQGAEIRVGRAADSILDATRELGASLLVVGTHGRSGWSRFALGSVAESVVRGASCSVLVVRLGDPTRARKPRRAASAARPKSSSKARSKKPAKPAAKTPRKNATGRKRVVKPRRGAPRRRS